MEHKITQAVILAGGYGTRLKPFTDTNPKPMYLINEIPFLEYLIRQTRSFGIQDIILLLGYLPEKIQDYFKDGEKWDVHIRYDVTPVEYETGMRILHAEPLLEEEFLLMYCDNYCPIDFNRLVRLYHEYHADLIFSAYANRDHYTRSNLLLDNNGQVLVYDKKREKSDLSGVDIGYAIVRKEVLSLLPQENHNFEAVAYPKLIQKGKLYAMLTEHRYYSIGSWERIELTKKFFSNKKYIFLDRDGTLNVRPPKACYIKDPKDFSWLPGAREAIRLLKQSGYTVVLITNQPGIARKELSEDSLAAIHQKMQDDLAKVGGHIDHIYYCPHNWDEGCLCRKPMPGMLFQAQKDLSLDLTQCWMLGDDERDMHAGGDAGCKCMYISEYHPLLEAVKNILMLDGKNE